MPHRVPRFDVDLDQLERLLWVLSAVGLGLALLGVAGERMGWWNDVGELLITFGTVASVATGVLAILINATKGQVQRVATGVDDNGTKLDRIYEDHGDKLDRIYHGHGDKLDRIYEGHGEKLDRIYEDHGEKLDRIHESHGDKLDRLHEDLTNQHDVLVQIRDRL